MLEASVLQVLEASVLQVLYYMNDDWLLILNFLERNCYAFFSASFYVSDYLVGVVGQET